MPANQFYSDTTYRGVDYYIDLQDEWDGELQDLTQATFTGGLRLGTSPANTVFTFTLLDDFTVRASLDAAQTQNLIPDIYNFGVRVNYTDKPSDVNDDLLFHGKLEIKETLF